MTKGRKIYFSILIFLPCLFAVLSCRQNEVSGEQKVFIIKHEEGAPEIISTRTNGLNEGTAYLFLENGYKFAELNFAKGELNGRASYFWEGNLSRIENYINGKLHGEFKQYDENSFISEEGTYLDDKKTGVWNYYEGGKLILSEFYGEYVDTIYIKREEF